MTNPFLQIDENDDDDEIENSSAEINPIFCDDETNDVISSLVSDRHLSNTKVSITPSRTNSCSTSNDSTITLTSSDENSSSLFATMTSTPATVFHDSNTVSNNLVRRRQFFRDFY